MTPKMPLPNFQVLQQQLTNHIRDPQNSAYFLTDQQKHPGLGQLPVAENRLNTYAEMFYNNIYSFYSQLFPILLSIVGDARFQEICRAFMQQHRSKTPLFHEFGQEFIEFLQTEFTPTQADPAFILELAHFEWAQMAVSIEPLEGPLNPGDVLLDWQGIYQLSPVAWPLAYQWPVQQMNTQTPLDLPHPDYPTTLLIYRDDLDEVQTLALSPILFEVINLFMDNTTLSAEAILKQLAEQTQQPLETLQGFAEQILQDLLEDNLIAPIG